MRSARENLKFFEDLAKMATGAMGSFGEVRSQVKSMVKERVDQLMDELDVVSRREFDRVEAMAAKARDRQEELEARLARLEKNFSPAKKTAAKTASARKPAAKKAQRKKK